MVHQNYYSKSLLKKGICYENEEVKRRFSAALASVHNFKRWLPHEIQDIKNTRSIRVVNGHIHFKHVTFHYNGQTNSEGEEHFVFKDQDIEINVGEKVGLVGQSGAGKSTFVNLCAILMLNRVLLPLTASIFHKSRMNIYVNM